MSNTKAIVVQSAGAGFSITIPAEAQRVKDQALALAAPIKTVTNGDEQAAAIKAAAQLKGMSALAEKQREEVKRPYWEAGKAIDATAKEYVKELDLEAKRLEKLVSDFQREEQRKREEAAAEAEKARKAAEAAAQAERDRLAEIERQKAAAVAAAAQAKTKKAKEAAEAEARRLEEERQAAELDAMEAEDNVAEAAAVIVTPPTPKASGAATSFTTEMEVTDIDALYLWDLERRKKLAASLGKPVSAFPPIFKMELKKADFKYITQSFDETEMAAIPGVAFTKVAKVAVRGTQPVLSLGGDKSESPFF